MSRKQRENKHFSCPRLLSLGTSMASCWETSVKCVCVWRAYHAHKQSVPLCSPKLTRALKTPSTKWRSHPTTRAQLNTVSKYAEKEEDRFLRRLISPSNWLWTGRAGDRIPARVSFSAPVRTNPGAHPAFFPPPVSLPGIKRPGHGVDYPPNLAPRLKKE